MVRVLVILALGMALAGRVGADGDPSATTASPLFRLEGFERGKVAVADISGDGRADLVLVSRHVAGESGGGPGSVTLWILERRGDGFIVTHEETLPAGAVDLDVGDPDGDGQNEAVVVVTDQQREPRRIRTRMYVIGRSPARTDAQQPGYCIEWSSAVWTVEDHIGGGTVRCLELFAEPLVAIGREREVRFFGWTGSTYAEVAD
ncbi:MAG: VCBS repeat-containing protein, partial [Armatimonadota bacterium]